MPDPVVYDEMIGTPAGKREYKVNVDIRELATKPSKNGPIILNRSSKTAFAAMHAVIPVHYAIVPNAASTRKHPLFITGQYFFRSMHALMTWSLHLAGRCVDCRNCEKACPSHCRAPVAQAE